MADEQDQRPIRSNEAPGRAAPSPGAANDPLAELARLIGQNDPFAEFGRDTAHQAVPPPVTPPVAPPAAAPPIHGSDYIAPPVVPPLARPPMPPPKFEHQPLGVPAFDSAAHIDHQKDAGLVDAPEPEPDDHFHHEPMHPDEDVEYAEYDDGQPPRRRMGVIAVAAVFALAIVGTAGAFGYRAMFGSSGAKNPPPVINADTAPSKIAPSATTEPKQTKLSYDRIGARSDSEKLVSREEQPVAIQPKPDSAMTPMGPQTAALQPALGSGVVGSEPKKIHTIVIHPDEPAGAKPAAAAPPPPAAAAHAAKPAAPTTRTVSTPMPAPRQTASRAVAPATHNNAGPLSLSPNAPPPARPAARPAQTASTAPAQAVAPPPAVSAGGHGYAVQLSAQRSEAEAQSSFRSMQAKYRSQLAGQKLVIRKVDLGTKGTYYRTLVGPFGSQNAAVELCTKLKAAGGKCFVQKI